MMDLWTFLRDNGNGLSGVGAMLACMVAAVTLWAQRKHNKLSVRPLPEIKLRDLDTGPVVTLANHGTGPMIVCQFWVSKNNRIIGDALIDHMPSHLTDWKWFVSSINGRSIPAGGLIELLNYKADPDQEGDDVACVREFLAPLTLHVVYKDVYDSGEWFYSRSLDWFGRLT